VNTGSVSGCSLSAANTTVFAGVGSPATYVRPDITLNGVRTNNSIETVLNAAKTLYLSPNDDVPFYNSNGKIIARIKNLSASDYACTQLTVDRAGTGAQAFWNNNPANYLTSKTLQVVPITNNPSGQYQITMYFTAAEKAGWEAATGQNWNTIQIVKVKSQVKNYSPSTTSPDGPGAVQTVTPTFGTFGSDYTLTAIFSSGFSGFAAGVPGFPLPVTLLDFTGRLDNNSVSLNWSTSSEQNSKNFEVEKATDGVNFYHIGSVNAAGNSLSKKDYSLVDDKLSPTNYYRLRMNDLDGHNKLSNVVLVKYDVRSQNVWVLTNPFKDYIDVRFAKEPAQATLQLFSSNGAMVSEKKVSNPSGLVHWQFSRYITSGSYILRTIVDGKTFTNKLIKQ
ncbi:MAG: T9SS type A sorting domain-containing protein, partial [Bacteroidota bacterium]|nr:T9SS type A sorting domain-containing protein [Bacteroidota bacterium]